MGRVRASRSSTDGTVLEEHLLPTAGGPTNCAFGGTNLDILYVTTLDGRLYRVPNTDDAGTGTAVDPAAYRSGRLGVGVLSGYR